MRAHSRPLLGLAYLLALALLIAFAVAVYDKALPWQRTVPVSLTTRTPGLELNPHSDVKFQGVIVGDVREITTDGRRATIQIALDPAMAEQIPADVDAMIVPKTLFGEKYVDLRAPATYLSSYGEHLEAGDAITQSTTSVEISQLFDHLVPVLRTLRPDQLSTVLNGVAEALDGRGAEIARTLRDTKSFLKQLDPSLPALVDDVRLLGETSQVYADSADDLLTLLGNAADISTDQLVPDERRLAAFLDSVVETSETTTQVLRDNRDGIVTLNGRARPVLELLETYSVEVPCVLRALDIGDRLANQATAARGAFIGLTIDMILQNEPYRNPQDLPHHGGNDAALDRLPAPVPSWAPHCPVLPKRLNGIPDAAPYSLQPYSQVTPPSPSSGARTAAPSAATRQETLRRSQDALARAVAGRQLDVDPTAVPGYVSMLLTPLVSEGEVTVE